MSDEVKQEFEAQMTSNPDLRIAVEDMALDIVAIRQVGIARDNLTIARLRQSLPKARGRFNWSIAALLALLILGSCALIAPLVIFILSIIKEPQPERVHLYNTPISIMQYDIEKNAYSTNIDVDAPLSNEEDKMSGFEIRYVTGKRYGQTVVFYYTIKNIIEDVRIEMHSARARDCNGLLYDTKYCELNSQKDRIIQNWKKDEEYWIEISIDNVPKTTSAFKLVSFSFQWHSKFHQQNSFPLTLEAGTITSN